MFNKINFSIRFIASLVMFVSLIWGCENEENVVPVNVEDLNGSWFGSFECNGLDNGNGDILCKNIKLTFLNSKYFTIELQTRTADKQFETVNVGEYFIDNDKLFLVQDECLGNDPECLIAQQINGNNIKFNIYTGGINIIFPNGMYIYEKID